MSRVFDVTGVTEMKIGFDNDKYLQLQAEHITDAADAEGRRGDRDGHLRRRY